MSPPVRDANEAPEAPHGQLPPQERPPSALVAVEDQAAPTDGPEDADPGEEASPGLAASVHVPYAKTDADPDIVEAPSTRPAPRRPARSPFWAAVWSHVWLVIIILVLVGVAGTAYWGLRVHQRIAEATLERDVSGREHAAAVRCVEQQSNGSVWACGLVYQASSVCLIANVNVVGDWRTKDGPGLCDDRPELTAILPARVTAAAVSADMSSQLGMTGARCAKVPAHKVRWACVGTSPGGGCLQVRVAPWRALATEQSTVCDHVPALRKQRGKA